MWIGDIIQKFESKAFTINGTTYYPADYVLEQLNILSRQSLRWVEDDFEQVALQMCDNADYDIYYDNTKFTIALEDMINNVDCEIGINWDTVGEYLEKHCRRSENSIKKALKEQNEETEL